MNNENKIRIIYKEPGKAPEWRTVQNDLHVFQDLVGGYIAAVQWDNTHYMVVNDEGKLQGLGHNFVWFEAADAIAGPCFWVAIKSDGFASITDDSLLDEIADYTGFGPDDDYLDDINIDLKDLITEIKERNGGH